MMENTSASKEISYGNREEGESYKGEFYCGVVVVWSDKWKKIDDVYYHRYERKLPKVKNLEELNMNRMRDKTYFY